MKTWKSMLSIVCVAVLAILLATVGIVKAAGSLSWQIVSSANVASASNQLASVAAVSANDVWAVGASTSSGVSLSRRARLHGLQRILPQTSGTISTLIEQWNGTIWNIVPGATLPANTGSVLNGVAVIPGTSNLWAVGEYQDTTTGFYYTAIEQWDNTSMSWSLIPSPNYLPTTNWSLLTGVVALSATNAWAVGATFNTVKSTAQTLIEHWNGTAWSIVRSSGPSPSNNILTGVTAPSANSVWAVGYYSDGNNFDETLTEHWNGYYWAVVASPNVQTDIDYNYLDGVTQFPGSHKLWAVGYTMPEMCPCNALTLVEELNGGVWSIVPSANTSAYNNQLFSVASLGLKNAWAVGYTSDSNFQNEQTLTEHWDGTSWSVVSSPDVASQSNYLGGVTKVPSSPNLWSVGYSVDSNSVDYTLAEYYG